MMPFLKKLVHFILPNRCLLCGKVINTEGSICADCFEKITFITKPYCKHCGQPFVSDVKDENMLCVDCLNHKSPFRLCRAAIVYDEFSKKLLLDFKFADHVENRKIFAKWLYLAGKDIFSAKADIIIPVPLHYTRLFKRKYNQSAILTREVSSLTGIPAEYGVLKKIRRTRPQARCNGIERKKNVKNAFTVSHADKIKGKRIILVDDIYTTGATMKECAKVLLKAGAKSVDALTVAKVTS